MKMLKTYYPLILSIFLKLTALHSLIVGLGLIFFPQTIFSSLGFTENVERFFPAQGGTFHIIISVCYYFAGKELHLKRSLIHFTIFVKLSASFFLVTYFLFVKPIPLVFLSFITDFIIASFVIFLYKKLDQEDFFTGVKKG